MILHRDNIVFELKLFFVILTTPYYRLWALSAPIPLNASSDPLFIYFDKNTDGFLLEECTS